MIDFMKSFFRTNLYFITVHYLDNTKTQFQMKYKTIGQELISSACETINVDEHDYFGLQFTDKSGNMAWIDAEKSLKRQFHYISEPNLYFRVKFYIADPSSLTNEFTRYLFALQISLDVQEGLITATDVDMSAMLAFILQGDLGDFDQENFENIDFKTSFPFSNPNLVEMCADFYKLLKGTLKAETDFKLLDKARRLDSYGKRLVKCEAPRSEDSQDVFINTDYIGVSIYSRRTLFLQYPWKFLCNVIFKGRKLIIIHCNNDSPEFHCDEYIFENTAQCKAYWKIVRENFSFYKDIIHEKNKRVGRSSFLKRGSRFRYSGRTLSAMNRKTEGFTSQNFVRSLNRRVSMHEFCRSYQNDCFVKEVIDVDRVQAFGGEWSVLITEEVNDTTVNGDTQISNVLEDSGTDEEVLEKESEIVKSVEENPPQLPSQSQSEVVSYHQNSLTLSTDVGSKKSLVHSNSLVQTRPPEALPTPIRKRSSLQSSLLSKKRFSRSVHQSDVPRIYEILFELFLSESVYCREMGVIANDFRDFMEEVISDCLLHEFTSVFSSLFQQHERLLSLLSENLDHKHVDQLTNCALAFFSTIFKSLNYYSVYLDSIGETIGIFTDTISTSHNFEVNCKKFSRQLYMPFMRLFLRPAQQLYYYQLILDGLLATCPYDDTVFSSFSGRLGHFLQEYEPNLRKILDLFCLYECLGAIEDLNDLTDRQLVRMGVVRVDSAMKFAFLFDHVFLVCQPHPETELFRIIHRISLSYPTNLRDLGDSKFSIKSGELEIVFETKTEKEKNEWVNDIDKLISAEISLVDMLCFQNGVSRETTKLDPSLFSIDVIQICWKSKICSFSSFDFFSVFKTTFSEYVLRQSKTNKQRFFVVLNNSCLYFFTDFFVENERGLPKCKQKLSILSSRTAVLNDPNDNTETFRFKIKMDNMATVLFAETAHMQNRWVNSVDSASI